MSVMLTDTKVAKRPVTQLIAVAIVLLISACTEHGGDQVERPNRTQSDVAGPISPADQRPNILLIVADDLGYTDLGVYGGEIGTPNLDSLAREGTIFTRFYTSPMCSPTRAMLLTGMDNHLTGLGNLVERLADNQKGQPGYEGRLNSRVVTLAELLADAGYRTYMTGKWHLGSANAGADPSQRGFSRSFALLDSGASYFNNMLPLMGPGKAEYSDNGVLLDSLPENFYSTRFYAEKMIEYLTQDANDDSPFFAYLAFTAPHFPLQAPVESIAKYQGAYDDGYDALHAQRLKRLQDMGLVATDIEPFPRSLTEQAWEDLSPQSQAAESRKMEIYAAMIDDLDHYVGKVIEYLKRQGEYDNTVIFFMSDNGAEGHLHKHGLGPLAGWAKQCCDNSFENLGKADSYVMLGPNWVRAAVAPFRMFKGFTSEGGIRAPAFVHFPSQIGVGETSSALVTVTDIMPTLLQLADVEHPGSDYKGRDLLPIQGKSMLAMLRNETDTVHGEDFSMGWELLGKRAIRKGDWKIIWETSHVDWWESRDLGIKRDEWQLYNLATDPAELMDLSHKEPEQLARMIELWESYARENGVVIPDKARGY